MLNHDIYGSGTQTLVIVHGLFGSGRNWRAIAKRLGQSMRVVTVDMRNHAGSFRSDEMGYDDMAADLLELIGTLGPISLLGHSMGGKASMVAALRDGSRIERLIVADIAPVAYEHSQIPNIDAMEAVDLSRVSRRSDADEQLSAQINDPALRAFFLQSLAIEEAGARWLLNLSALRRNMPAIMGFPDVSGQFDKPALFVTGQASDYVDRAGKAAIRPLFPRARFAALKGAGHWLHADQPKAFIATVQAFLAA